MKRSKYKTFLSSQKKNKFIIKFRNNTKNIVEKKHRELRKTDHFEMR
jgi:hypothetical protein